jgi:hypothetical protein
MGHREVTDADVTVAFPDDPPVLIPTRQPPSCA